MHVFRVLLFLRLTSLENFVRAQARRVRQPKYLAGMVAAVAYFWFFFFRSTASGLRGLQSVAGLGPVVGGMAALIVTALFLMLWVTSPDQPGLQFTEAEIAFLFPAPLARRALVHYKLLSALLGALAQALLFSVLFNRARFFAGDAPRLLVSWWAFLSIVRLHYLGASLTTARLAESGFNAGRRRLLLLGSIGALVIVTGWWLWRDAPDITTGASIFDWFSALLDAGPLHWVLWPARLLLRPFSAGDLPAFARTFVPVLLVLAAHYVWVIRIDVAFEEASLARAARQTARVAEIQTRGVVRFGPKPTKGRLPPFELNRAGPVELAFLWKNLLSTTRPWFTVRNWTICAALLVVYCAGFTRLLGHEYWRAGGVLAGLGLVGGMMTLFYGPLLTRLDIRQDLLNADILKTYPLPGWRILLGQMLAPVAILTGILWLALLAWYLGLQGQHPPNLSQVWFSPAMRVVLVACAAVLAPFLFALQLLVPNGAAILFPALFRTARTRGAGLDLMGQRLIFSFGQIFILVLVLAPGVVAAGILIFITQELDLISPAAAIILSTGASALVLSGEIWCGLWWLGQRFEQLDISSELRP